jgi:hypothetical protein
MGEPHVISALVKKRGELAWLQSEVGKLQRSIAKQIAHVDHVLAAVGYRDDPATIRKRRKNGPRMFKKGQLRRILYDILREGPCITTDRQFATEVMRRLKWDANDEGLKIAVTLKVRDVRKAIGR